MDTYQSGTGNGKVSPLPKVEGLDESILNKYEFASRKLYESTSLQADEWRSGSYPNLPGDIDRLPIPGGMYKGFWYWDSSKAFGMLLK